MSTSPYKVFVIEDNRTESMLLQLALAEINGIEVEIFPDGRSLLAHIQAQPDIIVLDLNLPDINGLDLIKHIKSFNPHIRIVVVSAQRNIDVLAQVQEQGVFNYLVKSESCLTYLEKVIGELLILIQHERLKEAL